MKCLSSLSLLYLVVFLGCNSLVVESTSDTNEFDRLAAAIDEENTATVSDDEKAIESTENLTSDFEEENLSESGKALLSSIQLGDIKSSSPFEALSSGGESDLERQMDAISGRTNSAFRDDSIEIK